MPGSLYPVNPRSPTILGLRAYPNINDIPEAGGPRDHRRAAQAVLPVLRDCARKRVAGVDAEQRGLWRDWNRGRPGAGERNTQIADTAGMRIIGPNCLGIYNPQAHLGYLDTRRSYWAASPSSRRAAR